MADTAADTPAFLQPVTMTGNCICRPLKERREKSREGLRKLEAKWGSASFNEILRVTENDLFHPLSTGALKC